ncbi:MAG: hypothetical protein H7246_08655 [Phycisphaerae bacterium]|nr:hypothetical protein [Saprospiraceae bacterium]
MQKLLLAFTAILWLTKVVSAQTETPLELSATTNQTPSFILTDPKEVLKHDGELVSVEGCVASAKLKEQVNGKPIFLDMFVAYPNNILTVAIWEDDQPKFLSAAEYDKKMVRITGKAKKKEFAQPGKAPQERVTISLHDPKQITILGDCPAVSRQ